jgi:hypothetical protein
VMGHSTHRFKKSPAMTAGVVAALVIAAGTSYFLFSQSGTTSPPTAVVKTRPGTVNPAGTDAPHPVSTSPLPGSLSFKAEVSLQKFSTKPKSAAANVLSEPKPATLARQVSKKSDRSKSASKRLPSELPTDAVPNSSAEASTADAPAAVLKQVQQFAFLKVGSSPQGARVYINGAQKGITPMIVRLDLGRYQVRFSRTGYRDVEREITLEKMKEYPLSETLTPAE